MTIGYVGALLPLALNHFWVFSLATSLLAATVINLVVHLAMQPVGRKISASNSVSSVTAASCLTQYALALMVFSHNPKFAPSPPHVSLIVRMAAAASLSLPAIITSCFIMALWLLASLGLKRYRIPSPVNAGIVAMFIVIAFFAPPTAIRQFFSF